MNWHWPLRATPLLPDEPGRFAAQRKHDVHTGVDLYCEAGTDVIAVEDGEIVGIVPFTGPAAGSPFWNETWAVLVEGKTGVVVYGEVDTTLLVGGYLRRGDPVGRVLPVLKRFKGRPMVMLHLELMDTVREPYWWRLGDPQPFHLLDPTPFLLKALEFNLSSYDGVSFRALDEVG